MWFFSSRKRQRRRYDFNVVKGLVPKLVKTTMSRLVVKKIYYEILLARIFQLRKTKQRRIVLVCNSKKSDKEEEYKYDKKIELYIINLKTYVHDF